MVDTLPIIRNSCAGSSKWRQHGCNIFVLWNTRMMRTGTSIPIPEENVFSSMLMTLIKTKYWTYNNLTGIWYIILTSLIDARFFSISHFMGARQSFIINPDSPFLVPYHVEYYIEILVLYGSQGVSSIDYKASTIYTILD